MQKSGENSQIKNRHFKRWFGLGIVVLATTIAGHDANSATNIDWNPINKLGYYAKPDTGPAIPLAYDDEINDSKPATDMPNSASPSEPATSIDWNPINKLGYYAKPDTGPAIPLAYDDEVNDSKPATQAKNTNSQQPVGRAAALAQEAEKTVINDNTISQNQTSTKNAGKTKEKNQQENNNQQDKKQDTTKKQTTSKTKNECERNVSGYTMFEGKCITDAEKARIESEHVAAALRERQRVADAAITAAMKGMENIESNDLKVSKWKDADGNFNTARLASDSIAGVVLGTAGGIITSTVVKKNQIKKGFEDISCTIGGQTVAGWGDQFTVGAK